MLRGGLLLDLGSGRSKYRLLISSFIDEYLALDLVKDETVDIVADAHNLPLRSECLDAVLCTSVLEHLKEPSQCISEVTRCLKPGGILLLSTCFIYPFHESPQDYYRFSRRGLKHLLEKNNLRIERLIKMGGLPSSIFFLVTRCLEVIQSPLAKMLLKLLVLMRSSIERLVDQLDERAASEDALGFFVVARKPLSN